MNRLKTFDATGVAPNGRLFAGDLNARADAVAALTDLTQNLSVGSIAIGESGLLLSRFGAGEARLAGSFRTDGIIRGLGGFIAGAYTTTARNAISAPPYGLRILNTDTNREEINLGTSGSPNWQPVGATPSTRGVLSAIPTATTVSPGSFYYATDQDSMWQSNGTSWVRVGPDHAGDLKFTLNGSAETGRVLCQGQAWPSTTDIYADLFAKWGTAFPTVLPDLRGRAPVILGTHTDVSAIAANDGLAVANRRPKHKHTVVQPTISGGSGVVSNGSTPSQNFNPPGLLPSPLTASGGTVGPQTGAEPTDTPAYYVVQVEAKL